MAKTTRKTASRSSKSKGASKTKRRSADTTSLSIRLTTQERTLLTTAAEACGDSPTHFIKSAAVAKAAHIVNISKPTAFDFKAVAEKVATLLFTKKFELEYRVRHYTAKIEGAWEVLTRAGERDEWDEHAGNGKPGQPPEEWAYVDLEDGDGGENGNRHAPFIRDDRVPMAKKDFLELQRAVALGGTEFLERVLHQGQKKYFAGEILDEPIDPRAIG